MSAGDVASNPRKEEEKEEEEEEQKVTFLELFSDLTFVVAIHNVAIPLEEEPDPFGTPLITYFLRVFGLWMVWYSGTLYTNIGNLFVPGKDQMESRHNVVVVLQMTLMTMISQATTTGDDFSVMGYFLAARLLLWFGLLHESKLPRPEDMTEGRYKAMSNLVQKQAATLSVEFVLLIIAMGLCSPGGAAPKAALYTWFAASLYVICLRLLGSKMIDRLPKDTDRSQALDLDTSAARRPPPTSMPSRAAPSRPTPSCSNVLPRPHCAAPPSATTFGCSHPPPFRLI